MSNSVFGTVLSGGGARGAYQAGVIRAVYEIGRDIGHLEVFRNLAGVSAGSINATALASGADDLNLTTEKLCKLWRDIRAEDVFRTDYSSVTRNALKLVRGISLGGFSEKLRPVTVGLLNTAPLAQLLGRSIHFAKIAENLRQGRVDSLCISATDYSTSMGVTFVQSARDLKMWSSSNRLSVAAEIGVEHIMGSCAIPVFFPPFPVKGRAYGDGCLRNTAPLSPAVHMGCSRLLVVGVRRFKFLPLDETTNMAPSLGRVLSVLINAIFMDAVEVDLERLQIINDTVKQLTAGGIKTRYKPIEPFYLNPSQSLSEIARTQEADLPGVIRFLLHGLGTTEESSELLSYLLFEPGYCSQLVDLGYKDTMARSTELAAFLSSKPE